MPTSRPFAYNTGSTISGTLQVGSIAVGTSLIEYAGNVGGVKWWNGPDEDLGYIITRPISGNTQPTPVGVTASISFWRTSARTDNAFVTFVNARFNQNFSTGQECKDYLNTNGYWTSYGFYILEGLTSGGAWSVTRKLRSNYTGNCIKVRRSNDNAEKDIGFQYDVLDTFTLSQFVGSNSAFITTIYDQSTNGYNFTQTTAANQPRIVNSGTIDTLNGKPCAYKTTGSNGIRMTVPSSSTYFSYFQGGNACSAFAVHSFHSASTVNFWGSVEGDGTANWIGVRTIPNATSAKVRTTTAIQGSSSLNSMDNSTTETLTVGNQYILSYYYAVSAATPANKSEIYVNGGTASKNNTISGSATSFNASAVMAIMGMSTSTNAEIRFQELMFFNSQPTLANMRNNLNNFYQTY